MKSKWKVSSTYAGGERFYQVYRLRDVNEVDHSGNREIAGTFDDEAQAQEYADAKNRLEEDE